jgi:HSP20 family protein
MANFSDLLNLPTGSFVRSFYGMNIQHPIDIIDRPEDYCVRVAAPGATDVSVSIEDSSLLIDMERTTPNEEEQFNIKGILDYSFSKTLNLSNANIDVDQITSKYSKGILEIILPKTEEAKPQVIPVDVTME